jgi:type IV fimbrial biogenesis protein FimT
MKNRTQTGFTLYELLITMLIVGIVLALGVPNMSQYRQNARMTSTANDLHSAFHLARSEASRAKTNITLCASANSMTAAADCGGTWDQGYIVFVDTDGNIATGGVNESILRAQPAIAQGVSLAVANDANFFSFSATGLGRGNVGPNTAITQVIMCDKRGNITAAGGNSASRLFVATPLGRATIQRDKAMIGAALTAMGKTCP